MSLPDFERKLLQSAERDQPSAERRRSARAFVLRGVGISVGVATVGTVAKSASSASSTATTTAGAGTTALAPATVTSAATLAKITLLAVGIVVGGVSIVARSRPDAPQVSATVPARSAQPAFGLPARPEAADPQPNIVEQATSPTPKVRAPKVAAARTSAVDPLSIEANLLQSARSCLMANDLSCTTTQLSAYRARFGHGALAEEATVLAIELARSREDFSEARRLASGLLSAHPSGPYAPKARALLRELGNLPPETEQ